MPPVIPLPRGVRELAGQNTHPGLALDKYPESWDPAETRDGKLSEKVQGPTLARVVATGNAPPIPPDDVNRAPNPQGIYPDLFKRWQATVGKGGFTGTTAGPLTLHLARASALENAGLCLHRVYGFAYLPGSGLKGLARAFAETVWLAAFETDAEKLTGWQQIEAVFGWVPGSNRVERDKKPVDKPWMPPRAEDYRKADEAAGRKARPAHAGAVVFHDAWPERWPKLVTDILNSHHSKYYSEGTPPGDWEDPVPVYFLSVEPGTPFRFAVAGRRSGEEVVTIGGQQVNVVELAKQWLIGGLTQLGAGAKTASGYGDFTVIDPKVEPIHPATRPTFTATLELVTPAFVGEANKHAAKLRSATVKAMLRKWWRAARGHLPLEDLIVREAAVFGSTTVGQGATVRTRPARGLIIWPRGQDMGGGGSPLVYLGYGPVQYDKPRRRNLTQLDALDAGQTVSVTVHARRAADRLELVQAVWLLTAIGGVGSRNRRGWGSLALRGIDWAEHGLPDLAAAGDLEEYRNRLTAGLDLICPTATRPAATAASWTAITTDTRFVFGGRSFTDWRGAMEDLGRKFMDFRSYDRRGGAPTSPPGPDYFGTRSLLTNAPPFPAAIPERAGFGLPYIQQYRSLDGDTATFTPEWMSGANRVAGRRASPLLFTVVKLGPRRNHWQVAYLPSQFLPAGAKVRVERTRPRPQEPLPFGTPGRAPAPDVFGVTRPGSTPQGTLVTDFLNWLEAGETTSIPPPAGSRLHPPAGPAAPPTGPQFAKGQRVTATVIAVGQGLPTVESAGRTGIVLEAPKGLTKGQAVEVLVERVTGTADAVFRWPK